MEVSKDYFINPACFGDDVALWLIDKLRQRGIATSAPDQEDFGWYFTYSLRSKEYCVVIGFQPNDVNSGDCWVGEIERNVGFIGSLFGGRRRGIDAEAVDLVDSVLRFEQEILDLEWIPCTSSENN